MTKDLEKRLIRLARQVQRQDQFYLADFRKAFPEVKWGNYFRQKKARFLVEKGVTLAEADKCLKDYYEPHIKEDLMRTMRTWQGKEVVFPIHKEVRKWRLSNLWSILTRKLF